MKNKRTFKHNQDIAAWFGRNFSPRSLELHQWGKLFLTISDETGHKKGNLDS